MANALWITLIGMGLVFVAILLLWGLMALLVRLTAEREPSSQPEAPQSAEALAEAPAPSALKARAAVAAVAAALALEQHDAALRKPASNGNGGAGDWQTVHRAAELNQRVTLNRNR